MTNWGVASSPGLVRSNNEDAVFAQLPVFVVADGMGGQAGGEVASGLVSGEFRALASSGDLSIEEVSRAIERANRAVLDAAGAEEDLAGMGTTLVGLVLVMDRDESLWLAFNIGDSRLYRLFDGELAQLTTDHSEVQLLVEKGAISAAEARSHPHRNVITRAIGADASVEPDFWLLPPAAGERFLLCSDGLTGEVDDDSIASLLKAEGDPAVAATRLIEMAVASGGHDNISVVVVDVLDIQHSEVDTETSRQALPVTRVPQVARVAPGGDSGRARPIVDDVPVQPPAEDDLPDVTRSLIEDVPGGGARPAGGPTAPAGGGAAPAGAADGGAVGG